jgi:hypothetical protein
MAKDSKHATEDWPVETVRTSLRLEKAADLLLTVHARARRKQPGQLVSELIYKNLNRYELNER